MVGASDQYGGGDSRPRLSARVSGSTIHGDGKAMTGACGWGGTAEISHAP
jgi:hypothetical protein